MSHTKDELTEEVMNLKLASRDKMNLEDFDRLVRSKIYSDL